MSKKDDTNKFTSLKKKRGKSDIRLIMALEVEYQNWKQLTSSCRRVR